MTQADGPFPGSITRLIDLFGYLIVACTKSCYGTFRTFGMACGADIAPVKEKPVMGISPLFRRNMSGKIPADSFDGCSSGKPYATGYPKYVSVHSDYRFAIDYGGHYIGGFASHSRQL